MKEYELRALKNFLWFIIKCGLGFLAVFYILSWISDEFHEYRSKKQLERMRNMDVKSQPIKELEYRSSSPSFKGNNMHTVWVNAYRDGHQFRATIKQGHNVIRTTECDKCHHALYVHTDSE